MQVRTFSASSGLDIQFLPDFPPFHVHALLLNPWATNKLLCQQPYSSLQFCLSLSWCCLSGSTFSDTWAGVKHLTLAQRKVRGWVKEELESYQGVGGEERKFSGVTCNFAVVHANRGTWHLSDSSWWLRTTKDSKQRKNTPGEKDWEVSDVAPLGKAFGKELTM